MQWWPFSRAIAQPGNVISLNFEDRGEDVTMKFKILKKLDTKHFMRLMNHGRNAQVINDFIFDGFIEPDPPLPPGQLFLNEL
jgi:hypothetical protein